MPKSFSHIIGITGSIATGKSTVTAILRAQGYPVICADKIAHTLTERGGKAFRKVASLFGKDFLKPDGEINRQEIAKLVFRNKKKRQSLEKLIHPLVQSEIRRLIRKHAKTSKFIFLDIPLLFESGMDRLCDATICVASSQKNQIARLQKFRGMNRSHALSRIRAQMPLKDKIRRADFVLKNNSTKADLKRETLKLLNKLKTLKLNSIVSTHGEL